MDAITGEKVMPVEERLKKFDQEIRKLYKSCKDAGYEPDKIRKAALPILHAARRGRWKNRGKRGLIAMAVVCVIVAAFSWGPSFYAMRVVTKKFMVKILPYYDWTGPFDSQCLMDNPYFVPIDESLIEEDCEVCKDLKNITVETNVSTDAMSEKIFSRIPNIVGDAMSDWMATKDSITFDDFLQMHRTVPNLKKKENFCFTRVSQGFPNPNITATELVEFLDAEDKAGRKPNFTATWTTCHVDSFKETHKLYYKPYHIPAMCEPLQHKSYVLLGRKSQLKTKALYLRGRFSEPGMWIAQIHGSFQFLLQPTSVCRKTCHNLKFNLTQGQILNVPSEMYNMAFRPTSEEALAIAVGYNYN